MMIAAFLPVSFDEPVWLWLLLLIPLLVVASWRSLAGLDPARRVLALATRCVVVLLVTLALAGAQHVRRGDELTVIFLMDRSHSVEALEAFQETYVADAAETMGRNDRLGLIDFARRPYLQQLPMRGGYFVPAGRLPTMPSPDRTDVAAAMRLALAMFPHDTSKRIVLLSDGNDNMGDLLAEARRAEADGVPVDVVPLHYEHRNEVYFERMIAPAYADEGEQVAVRMVLNTYKPASGTISLYQNGQLVEIPAESARVRLQPGGNTFFMKLPVRSAGTQTYKAVFTPDDESLDAVALNNTASAFTFVGGSSRVLVVSKNPDHDRALVDALLGENVAVDVKSAAELGEFGLVQMMNYAAIFLANVPAASFTDEQKLELAAYVRDMGSGLVLLGGDDAFGAGGWIGSPVEEISPVSFEIKHKRTIPRGALVLIMHSCEIARGNYWAKEMAKKSVDTISSQDYVGVLAYSFSPSGENWEVPLDLATNKAAVKAKIDRMQNGDMPDFARTMEMAHHELTVGRGRDAAQKHVILLSDGDAGPPSSALLQQYKEAKITVSTVGIGWGQHVMDATLRDIAEKTGGQFYPARNPRELPQIFVKESKVVRRPLIIEEPFQPRILHGYSELLGPIADDQGTPPLGGMVLTSLKDSANVVAPLVRMTEDGEDPVLAHWQFGLGKCVVFASGYWAAWGDQWTRWPKFAKFWAQIARWSMRQETPANFDTYTRVEGNRGRIVIDALDKDAGYLNNLLLRAKLLGPDNKAIPLEFTQHGPGNYQAEFDADASGQYLATVQALDGDRMLGTIRTGLSMPFSPEYRDLMPNEALLRGVADVTGGRWLPLSARDAEVFKHDLPPAIARKPAWDWIVAWLVLPAFLFDVCVRRLASWLALSIAAEVVLVVILLFGVGLWHGPWWGKLGAFLLADAVGWIIRFRYIGPLFGYVTHGATALAQTGQRSEAALGQLKGTRERVREGLDKGAEDVELGDIPLAGDEEKSGTLPRGAASRKFEGSRSDSGESSDDLSEALGGAGASPGPGGPGSSRPARPPGAAETESGDAADDMTSRLLRAKRDRRKE